MEPLSGLAGKLDVFYHALVAVKCCFFFFFFFFFVFFCFFFFCKQHKKSWRFDQYAVTIYKYVNMHKTCVKLQFCCCSEFYSSGINCDRESI